MKVRHYLTTALVLILGVAALGLAQRRSGTNLQPLSDPEQGYLLWMYEEEKLANEVYQVLFEVLENPVFENIAASEERHMDSVVAALTNHGIPIPELETGEFSQVELASLYTQLTEAGSQSQVAGLFAGAYIEEVDIADLEQALSLSENPALENLYGNLLRGSRNHLRAFVRQIEMFGGQYDPLVLTSDEFNLIVDSPIERGKRSWETCSGGEGMAGPARAGECANRQNDGLQSRGNGNDRQGTCDGTGARDGSCRE